MAAGTAPGRNRSKRAPPAPRHAGKLEDILVGSERGRHTVQRVGICAPPPSSGINALVQRLERGNCLGDGEAAVLSLLAACAMNE
jgi:hypothetical protein